MYVSVLLTSVPLTELAVNCFELCVSSCCDGQDGPIGPTGPAMNVPGCPTAPQLVAGFINTEDDCVDCTGPGYHFDVTKNIVTITFEGSIVGFSLSSSILGGQTPGSSEWNIYLADSSTPFPPAGNSLQLIRPEGDDHGKGFGFVAVICLQ